MVSKLSFASASQSPAKFNSKTNKLRSYIRSGIVDTEFVVTLEFIRDVKNCLKILKHLNESSNQEYREITNKLQNLHNPSLQDTYYNIMQQSERNIQKLDKQNLADNRNKVPSEHTIYIVVQISNKV